MHHPATIFVGPSDAAELPRLLASLPEEAIVLFAPGLYAVNLCIERSLTLRADPAWAESSGDSLGAVILDGGGRGPCVQILDPDCCVTIEGVTLQNGQGSGGTGGCLSIFSAKEVWLRQVELRGGRAQAGGGLFVRGGDCWVERCRFTDHYGVHASAVWVYQSAKLTLRQCVVADNRGPGPAITASWSAILDMEHCTVHSVIAPTLRAVGTGLQAPQVRIAHSFFHGPAIEVLRGGVLQPTVGLRSSIFTTPWQAAGIIDQGGNLALDGGLDPRPTLVDSTLFAD